MKRTMTRMVLCCAVLAALVLAAPKTNAQEMYSGQGCASCSGNSGVSGVVYDGGYDGGYAGGSMLYGADCGCETGTCGVANGCGGTCLGGLGVLVRETADLALTPVQWVAAMLSCGTYADCGCAPAPVRNQCDPCDTCGNWVGCEQCGGVGCSACAGAGRMATSYYNNGDEIIDEETDSVITEPATSELPKSEPLPVKAAPVESLPSEVVPTPVPSDISGQEVMILKRQADGSYVVMPAPSKNKIRPVGYETTGKPAANHASSKLMNFGK